MKLKKFSLSLIATILIVMILGIFQGARAYEDISLNPVVFKVTSTRDSSVEPTQIGYAIEHPENNGTTGDGAIIWEIAKFENNSLNYDINAYCVKAGYGFTNPGEEREYTVKYDMRTDKDTIAGDSREIISNLVNGGFYNELLAIADMMYLSSESSMDRLLTAAECNVIDGEDVEFKITENEVRAIQQAAIWYFTNSDEESVADSTVGKYDKTASPSTWFTYTTSGNLSDRIYTIRKL